MATALSKKPLPAEPPTEAQIRALLESSDVAVEEGILRLHARQTTDEQRSKDTKHKNCRGFSAAHAKKGSKYADWILGMRRDHGAKPGEGLRRADHKAQARELILHYVRQLHEEAVAKWSAAREAQGQSQSPFDADEAEFTEMIQQADRDDTAQAAEVKAAREDAENAVPPTPGQLVSLTVETPGWIVVNGVVTAAGVILRPETYGLLLSSNQLEDRGWMSKVLFGARTLWVRSACLRIK